jgi:hypothetical protein
VGKFHLAAHVHECFALFSLNFVRGIGQLGGEVIETLWSSLNKVSGQTCGMSQAHRQEVLDDHINELIKSGLWLMSFCISSNLLSLSNLAESTVRKLEKALQEREEHKISLSKLTSHLNEAWILEWKELEEQAMVERGDALRIYDVAAEKG